MFLQVLVFPHVEETRDPADSHYTSISKSASGPSRSQCQSAIWPYICLCLYILVLINIYVRISSIYWINYIKFYLSQSVNQYASGVRVVARPSPAHHVPGITGMWQDGIRAKVSGVMTAVAPSTPRKSLFLIIYYLMHSHVIMDVTNMTVRIG